MAVCDRRSQTAAALQPLHQAVIIAAQNRSSCHAAQAAGALSGVLRHTSIPAHASHQQLLLLLLLLAAVFVLSPPQHSPDACPPTGAERRRFYSRTTTEALQEVRQHQHKGAHPYRVVLGEVRTHRQLATPASKQSPWGRWAGGISAAAGPRTTPCAADVCWRHAAKRTAASQWKSHHD